MYKVVKIGDKDVPMLSMASVDVYFRQLFHDDPLKLQTSKDFDGAETLEFTFKMGFIMAMRAKKSRQEMNAMTESDYYDWLDELDRGGLFDAAESIFSVYEGQSETTADAKKNDGEQTDK